MQTIKSFELLNKSGKPDISLVAHMIKCNAQSLKITNFDSFREMITIMEYIRNQIPSFYKHVSVDTAYFLKESGHFMTYLTRNEKFQVNYCC